MLKPRKSLICKVAITMPMPDVKPSVTGSGIYSISRPKRNSAISTKIIPESNVAISRPLKPNCWVTGNKITTKAAVGPEILKRDPPVNAMIIPATMAVYNPCCGGTPLAMASAMESGMAIMPTVNPAIISLVK